MILLSQGRLLVVLSEYFSVVRDLVTFLLPGKFMHTWICRNVHSYFSNKHRFFTCIVLGTVSVWDGVNFLVATSVMLCVASVSKTQHCFTCCWTVIGTVSMPSVSHSAPARMWAGGELEAGRGHIWNSWPELSTGTVQAIEGQGHTRFQPNWINFFFFFFLMCVCVSVRTLILIGIGLQSSGSCSKWTLNYPQLWRNFKRWFELMVRSYIVV